MARKIYIARNEENTYNDYPCPIIFVPGVMGTRLDLGEIENQKYSWDPDDTSAMKTLAGGLWNILFGAWSSIKPETKRKILNYKIAKGSIIKNDIYEKNPIDSELSVKQGYTEVAASFYRKFLVSTHKWFSDFAKMPVYAFGYDWRQGNFESGKKLQEKILDVLDKESAKQCIIVTHSMGGYVARVAIKNYPDLQSKVLGVIHCVQPVLGATVLHRRFFTGMQTGIINGYDGSSLSPTDLGFSAILGRSPREFGENMSVLEGPTELLPTEGYPATIEIIGANSRTDRINTNYLYEDYKAFPPSYGKPLGLYSFREHNKDIRADLVEKISRASDFHRWLDGADWKSPYKHPNTFAIAGVDLKTDIGIKFDLSMEWEIRTLIGNAHRGTWFGDDVLHNIPPETVPAPEASKTMKIQFLNQTLPLLNEEQVKMQVSPRKGSGDGTVPEESAWGLFPDEKGNTLNGENKFDPKIHRQLTVSDIEHGDAFNKETISSQVRKLIVYLRNSPELMKTHEDKVKKKEKEELDEMIREINRRRHIY